MGIISHSLWYYESIMLMYRKHGLLKGFKVLLPGKVPSLSIRRAKLVFLFNLINPICYSSYTVLSVSTKTIHPPIQSFRILTLHIILLYSDYHQSFYIKCGRSADAVIKSRVHFRRVDVITWMVFLRVFYHNLRINYICLIIIIMEQ